MSSVIIRVANNNGVWIQAPGSNASISNTILRVTNISGAITANKQNVPTVASQITDFSNYLINYSNTAVMLANDATTYANAVAYVNNAIANVHVSNLVDVTLLTNPPANNSTLVYNTTNNKYIVEPMNLDGGNF